MHHNLCTLVALAIPALASAAALAPLVRQTGPVPPGTVSDCTQYVNARPGSTCASIATAWDITEAQFIEYNPSVKPDCSNLLVGYAYCVAVSDSDSAPTTTTTSSTLATKRSASPTPVQSGIDSECTSYYQAVPGDYCAGISSKSGITIADFEKWNPAVGSDCSRLFAGYYYCVAAPDAAPRPSPTAAGPQPQQTGTADNCNKYYKVVSGDDCASIESKSGITNKQFLSWNKALNNDCTNLYAGYYVCVGTS